MHTEYIFCKVYKREQMQIEKADRMNKYEEYKIGSEKISA